jgi:hypothetical protein
MEEEKPPSYWELKYRCLHKLKYRCLHKLSQTKHRDVWNFEKIPNHNA